MSRLTRAAMPPPEVVEGELLAGRYRLLARVDAAPAASGRPAALWLARDEVLTRRVAVKVLACEPGCGSASRLLAAAAAAGAVTSPALARVYDAAVEQRPSSPAVEGRDLAYVVREWVEGRSLAEALEQEGPFAPGAAVALTATLADALAEAHGRGLAHGRLHPGNVLVARGGVVRVTDLALSAALPGGAAPAERAEDGDALADDVRDLAAVLYALLTGRWPASATPQPAGGVPPAPVLQRSGARGRLTGPRSVGPAVPPALDAVVRRALDPAAARAGFPLTTTSQLVDALEDALGGGEGRSAPQGRRGRLGAVRGRLPALGILAVLSALGAAAFAAGSTVGSAGAGAVSEAGSPGQADADGTGTAAERLLRGRVEAAPGGTAALGAGDRPVLPLSQAAIRDFDPQGDGHERPETVAAAVDGDPSTAWTTERYDSVAFGGLKEGVGLLVDLGAPTAVSALELELSDPGISVELRGATSRGTDVGSYRLLAHGRAGGDRLALQLPAGTRKRFYLVWLTDLAVEADRFSAGVDELVLRSGDGQDEGRDTGG